MDSDLHPFPKASLPPWLANQAFKPSNAVELLSREATGPCKPDMHRTQRALPQHLQAQRSSMQACSQHRLNKRRADDLIRMCDLASWALRDQAHTKAKLA